MMKEQFIKEIQQRMLHYLNNEQLMQLGQVLNECSNAQVLPTMKTLL